MKLRIIVTSYKKAQVFKKDYVRKGGDFIRFSKGSGNHRHCVFELEDGESFDARGSAYTLGTTRWTATNCQSWAKFENRGGVLVALNFDGKEIEKPHWVRATTLTGEEPAEMADDDVSRLFDFAQN